MALRPASSMNPYEPTGPVLIAGLQALIRLLLLQAERDRRNGINTAGFVSGYRGSPLGGLDIELWRAADPLKRANIRFEPGVNEELAATAIWGAQQANLGADARFDGVFGLWYGKGPGVDRSGDAFRHANSAGTSQYGGVLAVAGDDRMCKSSTLVQQSEFAFIDAMMPVLAPANVEELIELGLYGFALSRYSGCWVGMIVTPDAADAAQSVTPAALAAEVRLPAAPRPDVGIRWPDGPLEQERRLHDVKIPAAIEFARVNPLNRTVWAPRRPRVGVVTAGKSYDDVMQALQMLEIDAQRAADLGLRLLKLGMCWPLEPDCIAAFADGLEEIIVVEEKRAVIEPQVKEQLYGQASRRPTIVGKRDERGAPLFATTGELSVLEIAHALAQRLARFDASGVLATRAQSLRQAMETTSTVVEGSGRLPHFCSGCPHNTSTRVPEGSRALAGIGCHFMAQWMDRSTETFTQMGGEGATWIGRAPFVATEHVFQNIGDGTYTHSGLLAIRAAVAARTNITFKVLYNNAVAMTGGQLAEGAFTPAQIAQQLLAEGVERVVIVADHPGRYATHEQLPAAVNVFPREDLDRVQRQLRDHKGVTALIYDQICAAEARRRRKRGQMATPPQRVEINALVCEGCGDCNVVSNCLAVVPLETEFGRKRAIDQSACNRDYSCLAGFCPSFVTVTGSKLRKRQLELPDDLPDPPAPSDGPCNVVIAGVGGTGVVTAGALLGLAAFLDGREVRELAQTGLAQKFGAVLSHARISSRNGDLVGGPRVADGEADVLLAADMLVAASQPALSRLAADRSAVVANSHDALPPAFIHRRDLELPANALLAALQQASRPDGLTALDATRYAATLLGDAMLANVVMLGVAVQLGLVPVSVAALERAVETLGAQADANRAALALGRYAAHDPQAVAALSARRVSAPQALDSVDAIVAHRAAFLTAYQDAAYASRYEALVRRAQRAEVAVDCGSGALAEAVARQYFRLLAYKDEYEVARLYTETEFLSRLESEYDGPVRVAFEFAVPLVSRVDPVSGRPRKRRFGPWIIPVLKLLARMRVLRGGVLDVFAYSSERKLERALIREYETTMADVLDKLDAARLGIAIELAALPSDVRGFGPVKAAAAEAMRARRAALLAEWDRGASVSAACAAPRAVEV